MFAALVHCPTLLARVLEVAAPVWGACPSDNGSMHSNVSVPHAAAVSCRASGSSFTATVGSCRASGSSFAATVKAPLRHSNMCSTAPLKMIPQCPSNHLHDP